PGSVWQRRLALRALPRPDGGGAAGRHCARRSSLLEERHHLARDPATLVEFRSPHRRSDPAVGSVGGGTPQMASGTLYVDVIRAVARVRCISCCRWLPTACRQCTFL